MLDDTDAGYTGITTCEGGFDAFVAQVVPCRSEHAREKPESTAGIQNARVIVDVHRERARSYSSPICN